MKMEMRIALILLVVTLTSQLVSCKHFEHEQRDEQQVLNALQAAVEQPAEESYQRVYEAFTKLVSNVSNNSLGNARRLVSRLNQLVGVSSQATSVKPPPVERNEQQQQNVDERTEQILNRLDQVNKNTDQHTVRQLQEDVNRLVSTLGDSYLRNVRRVIERLNKTIGSATPIESQPPNGVLHQSGDRYNENADGPRQPGFPGWDELITAVDRMQKSLASFVRSSTKLITAGK